MKSRAERTKEGSGAYPASEPEKKPEGQCGAFGCTLPGAISSNMGQGPWFCGLHHGLAFDALDPVTSWIRQHPSEISLLQRVRVCDPYAWDTTLRSNVGDMMRAAGHGQLAPNPDEPLGAYTSRLSGALAHAARAAVPKQRRLLQADEEVPFP